MPRNIETKQPTKQAEAKASIVSLLAQLPKKLNDDGGSSADFKDQVKESLKEQHDAA